MAAVLSDYLRVPRELVEAHHFSAFSYDLVDPFTKLPFRVETFEEDLDHYRFPRGNQAKVQRVFGNIETNDLRTVAPLTVPLKFTGKLYDEQKRLVREWLQHGYGVVQAPPRSGKTLVLTSIMCKLRQRTLMLAHLEDLCGQLEETIRAFTNVAELEDRFERQLVGVLEEWDDFFPIATLSTYQCFAVSPKGRKVLEQHRDDFGLVMVDEAHRCLGPGTIVSGRAIETLREGDTVQAYDGRHVVDATVRATMKSTVKTILTIQCESGRILAVTPNHPLWDGTQYRRADSFRPGDCLYGQAEDVCCMRQGLSAAQLEQQKQRRAVLGGMRAEASGCAGQTDDGSVRSMREASTLQRQEAAPYIVDSGASGKSDMLGSMFADSGATCAGAEAGTVSESDASRARPCGCIDQAETDGAQACCSGRQRSATERAAAPVGRGTGMADGVRGTDGDLEGQRLPDLLQSRHSGGVSETSGRGRRQQPLLTGAPHAGQKEGIVLAIDRVARVEVLEQGRDARFERLCPKGLVYNLTVEPHNNYFAGDLLVHNCKTELFREVVEKTTAAYRCGVTATPTRKDGMHVVVADTLGPVVTVGRGEQLTVQYTWEYTGVDVPQFSNWSVMWNRLVKRKRRDQQIAKRVVQDVRDGHCCLVTTERLQHLDDLKYAIQTIDPDITVGLLSSKTKDRDRFRNAVKRGEYQVVIAMNKIVELGYNVPRWSCFHNTLPMANKQNWYQRVSRIRTPMEPAFDGDDWVKPPPLARVWVDTGHKAMHAYRAIVKKENDRLGFECLNPPPARKKAGRKGFGFQQENDDADPVR